MKLQSYKCLVFIPEQLYCFIWFVVLVSFTNCGATDFDKKEKLILIEDMVVEQNGVYTSGDQLKAAFQQALKHPTCIIVGRSDAKYVLDEDLIINHPINVDLKNATVTGKFSISIDLSRNKSKYKNFSIKNAMFDAIRGVRIANVQGRKPNCRIA